MTDRLEAAAQYGVVAVRQPKGDGSVSWLTYWTPGTVIDTVSAAAAGWVPAIIPPRITSAQTAKQADRRRYVTGLAPSLSLPRMGRSLSCAAGGATGDRTTPYA
jgi:hypothetical protein